jgi:hypothetical protein
MLAGERVDEGAEYFWRQALWRLADGKDLQDLRGQVSRSSWARWRADDPGRQAQILDRRVHQTRMVFEGETGVLDEDQVANRDVAAPALEQLGRDAMRGRRRNPYRRGRQPRRQILTESLGHRRLELLDQRLQDGAPFGGHRVALVAGNLGGEQCLLAG